MNYTLAIHDGHTSTVCLLGNGEIKSVISEERLVRVKGAGGIPYNAIRQSLEMESIQIGEIDKIVFVGKVKPLIDISEYSSGRQLVFPYIIRLFPGDPRALIGKFVELAENRRLRDRQLRQFAEDFNILVDRIELVNHHESHAFAAYYLSPFSQQKRETLVITLDGSGDGLSGTVVLVDEKGEWKSLKSISTFDSLGMVYSRVTQYLSMKPWEHEYKLMGMAPYASGNAAERVTNVLRRYIRLTADGLGFENPGRLWGNSLLKQMRKDLVVHRFDAVAAGIQLHFERLLTSFVRNWLVTTGTSRLALGGGCFMNVKSNKLLMDLEECKEIFVMPSCGDESCAIGAAISSYVKDNGESGNRAVGRLKNLYLGPEYSNGEIEKVLARFSTEFGFRFYDDIEKTTAVLLSEDNIIGRLSGRMEWGARALGNRSILANPAKLENLRKLNSAIKMRDFWMPFAPSILWERRSKYAVLPGKKDHSSCFMMMAYESTEIARKELIAALHPYDLTMRPQFVKRDQNPGYHRLLIEFENITGIGGVLNTSFNLHGWPIVCSPEDALSTLLKSDLDYVVLNNFLVWKK